MSITFTDDHDLVLRDLQIILKKTVPPSEQEDTLSSIKIMLDDSKLTGIYKRGLLVGLFIYDETTTDEDEYVSIIDFWFLPTLNDTDHHVICKALLERFNTFSRPLEVQVSNTHAWLNPCLLSHGFTLYEAVLEKILPSPTNAIDVYELVTQELQDKADITVLLEKAHEFSSSFIDDPAEINALLNDHWSPVLIQATLFQDEIDIEEAINKTQPLIFWDEYTLTFRRD